MNKELLFQLYSIHSPSNGEKKMRKYVKRYIRRVCGECEIEQDSYGNVFVKKGVADSYPCLAAHLDQVQSDHAKDFEIVEGNDVVFGYSAMHRQQQGLGADDKNGIYICLECLAKYDVLKVAFFVGEEIGCKGSRNCDLDFFKDCKYIVEPDRMGGDDLITSMSVGKVCSDDFINALGAESFGYKPERGSITDVGELVESGVGISCLNLSCGYYCAHSDEEFTVLSELQNALDFVCHIIETLTEKSYPFKYVGYSYGRYGYGGYGGYSGYGFYGNKANTHHVSVQKSNIIPVAGKETVNPFEGLLDDEDSDYYACSYYDDDFEMMEQIITTNPTLTFKELVGEGGWLGNFHTRDMDVLLDMYKDVCEYYGCGENLFSRWDDDDDGYSFDDVRLRVS